MRAMVLTAPGRPLEERDRDLPAPGPQQVLARVSACAVCRTDLHVVDGDLPGPRLPVIPGHEIVGHVAGVGAGVSEWAEGTRVGVPWLGWTCGACAFCRSERENLCARARFTGYTLDGGYAEYVLADARYCFRLPAGYSDVAAAPLMCAGRIGYRALRMAEDAERIGLYGFGAAAHLIAQVATGQGRRVFAVTRQGDTAAQSLALSLGATWAGGSGEPLPEMLDAAILFAPVGALVPEALRTVDKGGTVVCAGIHVSDIPSFPYALLWEERVLRSVANLTRRDGEEFLEIAGRTPLRTETHAYPLRDANRALADLRAGAFTGAAVLVPSSTPQG